MKRFQAEQIIKDLEKKIVFLVGPRQVGKTWLSKEIGVNFKKTVYLNYDRLEDREIMKKEQWPEDTDLLILDELHKMKGWKNYLKGVYDTKLQKLRILVTGSARLEAYSKTGDSLAGRHYIHHLLPFSAAELEKTGEISDLDSLLERGGFPEPLLASSDIEAARWRTNYVDSLVRNDVLDFKNINDYQAIKTVFELLRRKVGSPISYSSIARDAEISPATAKNYINILESLYIVFRVAPHSNKIAQSILKEPKIYFYDNGLVIGEPGIVFENFIATSLLKSILGRNDFLGESSALRYLRTKNGQEVDFAIADGDKQLLEIIEVKLASSDLSKNLAYFCERYNLKGVQVVKELKRERKLGPIQIVRAENFLKNLYL